MIYLQSVGSGDKSEIMASFSLCQTLVIKFRMKHRLIQQGVPLGAREEAIIPHTPVLNRFQTDHNSSFIAKHRIQFQSLDHLEPTTNSHSHQNKTLKKERRATEIKSTHRKQRSQVIVTRTKSPRIHTASEGALHFSKFSRPKGDSKAKRNRITEPEEKSKTRGIKLFSKECTQDFCEKEYILIGDRIVCASKEQLLSLESKMEEQKEKDQLSNESETSEQFYEFHQYYTDKAVLIQKVWRGYSRRKLFQRQLCRKQESENRDILEEISQLFEQLSRKESPNLSLQEHDLTLNRLEEKLPVSVADTPVKQTASRHMIDLENLSPLNFLNNHQSLLQDNVLLHDRLLDKLSGQGRLSELQLRKKKLELQRWSYVQNNEINYLRKILQRQVEKSVELLRMRDKEALIHSGLETGRISDGDIKDFINSNLLDEKYNFSYYLFPEGDSAILEASIHQKDKEPEEDKNKSSQQLRLLSEMTPLDRFPQLLQEDHRTRGDIEQRVLSQMSYVRVLRVPVDTSIQVINNFINCLCIHISKHWKYEFLTNINSVYGGFPEQRLKQLQGYPLNEEVGYVISQSVFDRVVPKTSSVNSFERIHNKAIFDTFNECLHSLRPYYMCNGMPFPWDEEKALTFYEIGEENILEVFDKIKYRVMRLASSLCGLMIPGEEPQSPPTSMDLQLHKTSCGGFDNLLASTRDENVVKSQIVNICEQNYLWFLIEDEAARLRMELSELVFSALVSEAVSETFRT